MPDDSTATELAIVEGNRRVTVVMSSTAASLNRAFIALHKAGQDAQEASMRLRVSLKPLAEELVKVVMQKGSNKKVINRGPRNGRYREAQWAQEKVRHG